MRNQVWIGRLAVLLVFVICGSCSVNPATGKRQLMLVSEAQEIQLGFESDKALTSQLGLYPDDALQEYVQRLGEQLAATSERPNLDWQFRVVDDPVVNAFALPGGFIYMTRGILAHFNNEAELVSVLGHEIGHVTARHGASQMSKAQLSQLGMVGGMIAAPEQMQRYGNLVQTGMGLMFLKFSRDDETQADNLGFRYLVQGGYDPRPMADVFDTLGRVGAAQGSERLPGWMSTHPHPENRGARIDAMIAASGRDYDAASVNRNGYLDRIQNIVFGEDPRQGYFKEALFLHPELEFQLAFPAGWTTVNQRSAVIGVSPQKDAMMQLTLTGQDSAAAALQQFLSPAEIQRANYPVRVASALVSAGSGFVVQSGERTLWGVALFVELDGRVYQLLAYTTKALWNSRGPVLEAAVKSFDRVQDRRVVNARPDRLEIVNVSRAMSVAEFAQRYESSVEPATLALINGVDLDARLKAGQRYKVVRGGYTP